MDIRKHAALSLSGRLFFYKETENSPQSLIFSMTRSRGSFTFLFEIKGKVLNITGLPIRFQK